MMTASGEHKSSSIYQALPSTAASSCKVRIATIQLACHPAFAIDETDWLCEPFFSKSGCLQRLKANGFLDADKMCSEYRDVYLRWSERRLRGILEWMKERFPKDRSSANARSGEYVEGKRTVPNADHQNSMPPYPDMPDILVFPEGSIPRQHLYVLQEFAFETKTVIFAGSHIFEMGKVPSADEYRQLGILPQTDDGRLMDCGDPELSALADAHFRSEPTEKFSVETIAGATDKCNCTEDVCDVVVCHPDSRTVVQLPLANNMLTEDNKPEVAARSDQSSPSDPPAPPEEPSLDSDLTNMELRRIINKRRSSPTVLPIFTPTQLSGRARYFKEVQSTSRWGGPPTHRLTSEGIASKGTQRYLRQIILRLRAYPRTSAALRVM